jgi:hypothetical protein
MEDFIDSMYQNRLATNPDGDTVFINNDKLVSEYVVFYGDSFITKSSLTRKLKEASVSFLDYEIHRTSKRINGKTYRGFVIKRCSNNKKLYSHRKSCTPLLTITIEVKTKNIDKFPKWAETISQILSTFYPEIEEFDFSLSSGDKELSTEKPIVDLR